MLIYSVNWYVSSRKSKAWWNCSSGYHSKHGVTWLYGTQIHWGGFVYEKASPVVLKKLYERSNTVLTLQVIIKSKNVQEYLSLYTFKVVFSFY